MKRTNPSQLSAVLTALLLIGFAYSASSQSMLVLSNKWGIQAGTRSYLNTTNNWPRGIMINRTTGHVLIPTGTPVPQVNILRDGDDGRE